MKKSAKDEYFPFVRLEYELLDSAVWTAISYESQWLYIEIKKAFDYSQGGYDHLVFPYSKIAWRMTRNTFWKKIVKHGGLMKQPNVYALSEGWKQKSREIVDKEGKGAILAGYAKKRTHRAVADNLPDKKRRESQM